MRCVYVATDSQYHYYLDPRVFHKGGFQKNFQHSSWRSLGSSKASSGWTCTARLTGPPRGSGHVRLASVVAPCGDFGSPNAAEGRVRILNSNELAFFQAHRSQFSTQPLSFDCAFTALVIIAIVACHEFRGRRRNRTLIPLLRSATMAFFSRPANWSTLPRSTTVDRV